MFYTSLLRAVTLTALTTLTFAQIPATKDAPAGYQVGMSTQDNEPAGQQSSCTINGGSCKAPTPLYPTTAGPEPLPEGVFAAAINPALGGGPNDCAPCGTCYSIMNAGMPYCDGTVPGCGGAKGPGGPKVQSGPKEIKVVIVNHCPDCDQVAGHFDINAAPAGWDNPKIFWKQLDPSECGGGGGAAAASGSGNDTASTGEDTAGRNPLTGNTPGDGPVKGAEQATDAARGGDTVMGSTPKKAADTAGGDALIGGTTNPSSTTGGPANPSSTTSATSTTSASSTPSDAAAQVIPPTGDNTTSPDTNNPDTVTSDTTDPIAKAQKDQVGSPDSLTAQPIDTAADQGKKQQQQQQVGTPEDVQDECVDEPDEDPVIDGSADTRSAGRRSLIPRPRSLPRI